MIYQIPISLAICNTKKSIKLSKTLLKEAIEETEIN